MPKHSGSNSFQDGGVDRQQFQEIAEVLRDTIRQSRQLLEKRFKIAPKTKRYKLFILIVLTELVRKCESVDAMAKANTHSGINAVTRSAFESYADLLNLLKYKDDYADFMIWVSHNQQRSFLQPMTGDKKSGFSDAFAMSMKESTGESPDQMLLQTLEAMGELEQNLPDIFKNKHGKVQTRDMLRFELANKADAYNLLYRHLSGGAHGRLSAMLEGIATDDGEIQWPPSDSTTPPLVAMDSLCAMLIETSGVVAKQFQKPEAPFKQLARNHAVLRRGAETAL